MYAEVDDTEFEELTSSWKESTSGKHVIPIRETLRRQGNNRRCPGTKVADRIKMVAKCMHTTVVSDFSFRHTCT